MQSEGDLGNRLYVAAAESFDRGKTKVILIGTDCPLLGADILECAIQSLNDYSVVLGSATDGGYYLIGMRNLHKSPFEGIAWGGPTVLQQTIRVCEQRGLKYTLLQELPDVDTPDDLAAWGMANLAAKNKTPGVSIVIPTRNEEEQISSTIASALFSREVEIIVSDAGSTDRTREIARAFGAKIVECEPSRGLQLNAGAAIATSSLLLFLHADTTIPHDYAVIAMNMLQQSGVCAGAFELRINAFGMLPRMIEYGTKFRARMFGRPYGDQAMFMTRDSSTA